MDASKVVGETASFDLIRCKRAAGREKAQLIPSSWKHTAETGDPKRSSDRRFDARDASADPISTRPSSYRSTLNVSRQSRTFAGRDKEGVCGAVHEPRGVRQRRNGFPAGGHVIEKGHLFCREEPVFTQH